MVRNCSPGDAGILRGYDRHYAQEMLPADESCGFMFLRPAEGSRHFDFAARHAMAWQDGGVDLSAV